ncbi:MAG: hypothetical protein M1363_06475 [Gammaproteobacteria bacterium]|nr:hypothetical protein [Gammaproteobacteria bacterium]
MENFQSALHAIPFLQHRLPLFRPEQQLSNTVLWAYQTAAEQLGVRLEKADDGYRCFLYDNCIGSVRKTKTDLNSQQAIKICNDKALTKHYLRKAGVAVAADQLVTVEAHQQALSFAQALGFQVVVKPLDARAGEGITTEISNADELMAVQAATSIPGLKFAGVDFFSSSLSDSQQAYVLEVNTQSNIGIHAFPIRGKSRNVAYHVIQYWLANAVLKNT